MTKTGPGRYDGIRNDGKLVDLGRFPAGPAPDAVICRRVADYPDGQLPPGGALGSCSKCGAPVAFNPAGPHQQAPRCCMQCAGIRPLPIDPAP